MSSWDEKSRFAELLGESPRHGDRGERGGESTHPPLPRALSIAISREAGARGGTIGRRVGRKLGWEVYDKELLEYVSQEGAIRQEVTEGLEREVADWIEGNVQAQMSANHLDPDPATINLARTIYALGAEGRVLFIGRGAGYLLPRDSTLHVRLIAPLEERIAYLAQWLRLTREEAEHRVQVRDSRRAEFLQTCLHRQSTDLYAFDLILNTSYLGEDQCAELITQAARAKSAQRFAESEESQRK